MAVMCVFGQNDFNYEGNGAAILSPIQRRVSEEAGANYELTFTHPVDRRGVWTLLQPGAIVKASVPGVKIGEVCLLRNPWENFEVQAEVVGFTREAVLLTALGAMIGISAA